MHDNKKYYAISLSAYKKFYVFLKSKDWRKADISDAWLFLHFVWSFVYRYVGTAAARPVAKSIGPCMCVGRQDATFWTLAKRSSFVFASKVNAMWDRNDEEQAKQSNVLTRLLKMQNLRLTNKNVKIWFDGRLCAIILMPKSKKYHDISYWQAEIFKCDLKWIGNDRLLLLISCLVSGNTLI